LNLSVKNSFLILILSLSENAGLGSTTVYSVFFDFEVTNFASLPLPPPISKISPL